MARSNVELVERVYQAFRRRDFPEIFRCCAPDVEVLQSAELPWGGEYRGHEEVMRYFGTLTKHISSSVILDRFIDAGDHVVAMGRTRGTVLASGRRFDVPVVHVWHVRDGQIAKFLPYLDCPGMKAALVANA
jgi:ketosteroid isomerase-like protein